jgi:hypothetical protein
MKTLSMKFGLASGKSRSITLGEPKDDLTAEQARSCMDAAVTAGSAFADPLQSIEKATVTERNVTVLVDEG